MTAATDSKVLTADERCWRPYLLNGAIPFVYWLATTLSFVLIALATSVTRFAPGAALPDSRLALLVIPDPDQPGGPPLLIPARELDAFRSRHPGAGLAPQPAAAATLAPDARRTRRSLVADYSARPLVAGGVEVTVHGKMPFRDSMASFGYVTWRYRVNGERIEPQVMLEFDPFLTWFVYAFLGFGLAMSVGRTLEWRLIDRPLAQGRWRMQVPLNRDWLVTRGIPLRFEPPPASLDVLAAAMRDAGAAVRHQPDQAALAAEFGHRATLTANLRHNKLPALDVLINGGRTSFASLLLVLVAPIAALIALGAGIFWMLDPFAEFSEFSLRIVAGSIIAAACTWVGASWLRRPGLTDEADRLAGILFSTLAAGGAQPVPVPRWPRLQPPLPKWRRWLRRILVAMLFLLPALPFLGEIITDLLR